MTTPDGQAHGQISELRNAINALRRRLDNTHRLLLLLTGIGAAALITAAASLAMQLLK